MALSNAVRPGLVGWLKTASREVGPKGITVNCVAPGRIDTERLTEVYPTARAMRTWPDPGRALGTPREIGDVVCFLASERAAYVTGATIAVDGGLTRAGLKPRLLIGGLVLGALAVGAAWILPSNSYLLLPDAAKPLVAVKVQGEKRTPRWDLLRGRDRPQGDPARGAVRARVPTARISCPAGARAAGLELRGAPSPEPRQMDRSEQVAAAVALRELGYKVDAKPEGALVVAVAPDAPAAGKLEPTEVIVASTASRCAPGGPAPADREAQARRDRAATGPRRRGDEGRRGRHGREPGRAADRRSPGRAVRQHQAPDRRRHRSGGVGGPSAGLAFALDIVEELRGNVDHGLKVAATGEIELDGASSDRRRQAEGDRCPAVPRRCVPRPGWGKRSGGTAPCRGSPDHPCGEFSTGVACIGNAKKKTLVSSSFFGRRILRKMHGFPQKGA